MDENPSAQIRAITENFSRIQSVLRRSSYADLQNSGVTAPQVRVINELLQNDGLTLNELCAKLGLAHSTVSGIIDRLEQRHIVQRRPGAQDKRCVNVYLDKAVMEYVNHSIPSQKANLLKNALQRANRSQRTVILNGLVALCRLIEAESEKSE